MTPTHRDLDDLTQRFPASATLAAAGYGTTVTLSFVGLRPHVGLGWRMRRGLAWLAAALSTWHERARQRSALMELSDYMLCDIGVSRAAAIGEADKPFWRALTQGRAPCPIDWSRSSLAPPGAPSRRSGRAAASAT